MQPCLGTHAWSSDLWAHYYTPNRCTAVSKHHDPPTFDPTCIYATAPPANLAPSTEDLKHIYPSPPHTDSDPKHTVPLPTLSEDSPSHAEGTPDCPHSHPLTLPCPPTPLTRVPEGPLTSHPSTQDLPLSPPPSLPMVPHALPEATTSCYTLDRVVDACDDADVELDAADDDSQSSSSPEEPPPSDLLTPLTPMWYLPLDDDDTRPAGILEVSTHLSRPLVSSPPRLPAPAVQATDGDRMTLSCGSNHSKVESQCGQLRPFVAPPDGLAGARFTMFQTFFSPPAFDVLSSDGFPGHSYPSGGKLFNNPPSFLLSETGSPYILPKLTLIAPPPWLPRRISLPSLSPDEYTDSRDALVSCDDGAGTLQPSCPTTDMPRCASANSSPISLTGTEPSVGTKNLSQWDHPSAPEVAPRSPLVEFEGSWTSSPSTATIMRPGSGVTSNLGPMIIEDADIFDRSSLDWGNFESDVVPPSPSQRAMSVLDLDNPGDKLNDDSTPSSPSRRSFADPVPSSPPREPFANPAPSSPCRRSFADLPDTDEPPQSPLLSGSLLRALPGATPDNTLITAVDSGSDWSSPRGSGLGLFLPIQAASSNQFQASEPHPIEPNLNFSPEAIARVDSREFEKLKSVRRRTWVSERKAKEDEVDHAKCAEDLASRLSVAPPVPSKLPDFDERGGVSAGADAEETEGPPGELGESDEKTIRSWLLYTEAKRADARRLRKREKELGRELQALLRLKLGEDPDATVGGVESASDKVKPGKTAIVSMPQLVARMIMKRRDTPRPFSPRKHDASYICSPLSRFEPTVGVL